MRGPILVLVTLLALPTGVLQAQRLAPDPFPTVADRPASLAPNRSVIVGGRTTHPALLALGGVVGGAVGVVGGAIAGARATEARCEDCAIVGGIYGAVAGGSVGLPLGVHVANRGRGSFLPALGASLAIGGAGLGVALLANDAAIMIPVPVLQLVAAILIERSTSRP
jgi:hypothetical protein